MAEVVGWMFVSIIGEDEGIGYSRAGFGGSADTNVLATAFDIDDEALETRERYREFPTVAITIGGGAAIS